MAVKKIVVGLSFAVILSAGILIALLGQAQIKQSENTAEIKASAPKKTTTKQPVKIEKKYDLYSSTPYEISLASIYEISKLSTNLKKTIDECLERAGGILYLKKAEDNKVVILLQNGILDTNTYMRHNLEMVEISENIDGTISKNVIPLGYSGYDGEINNVIAPDAKRDDYWKYDKSVEPYRPLKHTIYDENGKTKFTEYWDYSAKNPLKYVMKDSKGKIISLFKEEIFNETNLRQEHIFYDENENIEMSVSVNYDGANISRFTYYNSNDIALSTTIMTEYLDGIKSKESIYTNNYELVNTLSAEYLDGERKYIRLFDVNEKQIDKISS